MVDPALQSAGASYSSSSVAESAAPKTPKAVPARLTKFRKPLPLYKDTARVYQLLNLHKDDKAGMNYFRDYVAEICAKKGYFLDKPYGEYQPRLQMDLLSEEVAKMCDKRFKDEIASHTFSAELAKALIHRICLDSTREEKRTERRHEKRRLELEVTILTCCAIPLLTRLGLRVLPLLLGASAPLPLHPPLQPPPPPLPRTPPAHLLMLPAHYQT
jgi:hypothetical protein